MTFFNSVRTWWSGRGAMTEAAGSQVTGPSAALVSGIASVSEDAALQIGTVWACIERRANTLASLPFFAYNKVNGRKEMAESSRLYQLLHESPNSRMTPFEFWRAMVMNHDLRGNAYARLDRDDATGEVISMWPMPASQVEAKVLPDASMVYVYRIGNDVAVLADTSVLVIKNLGNGTKGMDKLQFMQAALDEASKAQSDASKLFGAAGKPSGILMVDKVLKADQRAAVRQNFLEMGEGSTARLHVLEADMKYQQLTMTPEQQQLLETRQYGVEELCRWLDVPPVLAHHSNVTAWGSGIFQIMEGFTTFAIRPLCINIEQSVRKRVMTPRQRVTQSAEFSMDALLRGSLETRAKIYSQMAQNGLKTRNECRALENDPAIAGGDEMTVQSNLVPIHLLGKVPVTATAPVSETPTAQ